MNKQLEERKKKEDDAKILLEREAENRRQEIQARVL